MTDKLNSEQTIAEVDLNERNIDELAEMLRSRSVKVRQIVEFYLARIAKYNHHGPHLGCVLEVNPDALHEADALDAELHTKGPRSVLHGIPFLVKDCINTKDKTHTSNGSYLFYGNVIPAQDATVVALLRKAGALMLGKANMSELASIPNSVSARGGVIRNPYDFTRSTCGSSSGSAAGVSSNFATFSLGTDNLSSIRFPAADACVVGLKPTPGLIGLQGVFPASPWNVIGILARSSSDVERVLSTVAEHTNINGRAFEPTELRVGIVRGRTMGATPEVDVVMESSIEELSKMGATVIDNIEIPEIILSDSEIQIAQEYNRAATFAYYDELDKSSPIRSKAQMDFLSGAWSHPSAFNHPIRTAVHEPDSHSDVSTTFGLALDFLRRKGEEVAAILDDRNLDVLAFPTKATLPFLIYPSRDTDAPTKLIAKKWRGRPEMASWAGLPEISVPAGFTDNELPVGISFMGRPFDELTVLRVAKMFEQYTRVRRPPDLDRPLPDVPNWLPSLPDNDRFDNAVKLPQPNGQLSGNTYLATLEPLELHRVKNFKGKFLVDCFPNQSVWYKVQPVCTGTLSLSLEAYASDHRIFVYEGNSLEMLQEVSAKRTPKGNVYPVRHGIEYRIAVTSKKGRDLLGEFILHWSVTCGSDPM